MTMGAEADAHATLQQLIDVAAPEPLPADQAIPLLREVQETDVAALARLAYRALTGVDPGDEPRPAAEALPDFPVFAGEVLMRAIDGPDERRPTPQALLVVLEAVPPTAWPTHSGPQVSPEAGESAGADDDAGADEPTEAANPFHDVIAARRPVPRFEPLEGAGQVPGLGEDPQTRRRSRRRRRSTTRKYAADRRQTLILVAVILAVIVLGVLYATFRSTDEPIEQETPSQGAPGWPTMTR